MIRTIIERFRLKLYDEETGKMLNYLTLNISNKEVLNDIAHERAYRITKYYGLILLLQIFSFIN